MEKQDIISLAKKHSIRSNTASPDFFEGAVMGNGALGLVVCTRPDAVVLHFGHNSIWDIRIEEGHRDKVGTFREIWSRILEEKDTFPSRPWYREYREAMLSSYARNVYPRPFPASSVYLFFDRKEYEVLGHELDLSDGLLSVTFEASDGRKIFLRVLVSMEEDRVLCETVDGSGATVPLFCRMRIVPNPPDYGLPEAEPLPDGFRQLLPANGYGGVVRPGVDKGFSLLYRLNGTADRGGLDTRLDGTTSLDFGITEGFFDQVEKAEKLPSRSFEDVHRRNAAVWAEYWERSGVRLGDEFLEHLWYTNTYFIRCVLSRTSRCPGLFGNWMCRNVGTAWHGDYHMNYNTQQPFWGLMAANRQELHFPYLRMVESLMPISEAWARDFYELDGAYFPHSAFPVPMTVNPYPLPGLGWEICETPWTVQSLWWHYTYTGDKNLLRERVYPPIRAAAAFLAGYMTREGADPEGDGKCHIYPSMVPELYDLAPGLSKNLDVAADLTFTKFVFKAVLEAVGILGLEEEEKPLTDRIRAILSAFPDYPTAEGRFGEVFLSVKNEDPDRVIYNCPANLMQIFPGEDTDRQSADAAMLKIAETSWLHHYNEGGNDIVFYYLIGARLGIMDLEKFKRHVRYCLMPNGTAADRVTLTGGRYDDTMDFDFMSRMGIWVENLSLYAVVDECLLWGHTDTIVLFPNWDLSCPAEFRSLRTKGAFLVDAACADGTVSYVRVTGERGGCAKLKNPWKNAVDQDGNVYEDEILSIPLGEGKSVRLTQAE